MDDEPDVIETLEDLLAMCTIDTAVDFETAEKLLKQNPYDVAILDIMGVDGYKLLDVATENDVPALMLTAHALSPDNLEKSVSGGAEAYIPKEKMSEIDVFLSDLLKARQGDAKSNKWFLRLKSFFEMKFGKDWLKAYQEVKDEVEKRHGPIDDF